MECRQSLVTLNETFSGPKNHYKFESISFLKNIDHTTFHWLELDPLD